MKLENDNETEVFLGSRQVSCYLFFHQSTQRNVMHLFKLCSSCSSSSAFYHKVDVPHLVFDLTRYINDYLEEQLAREIVLDEADNEGAQLTINTSVVRIGERLSQLASCANVWR